MNDCGTPLFFGSGWSVDELICQTTGRTARVCKEQIKIELLADSSGVKLKCLVQMEGERKINTIMSDDIKIAPVQCGGGVLIHRDAQLMIVRTAM